ncbi:MAG: discoidin domain-containing protein [Clostridia bacterium]|nr:discoidin domain-containing protein [Clostridia bacterium]
MKTIKRIIAVVICAAMFPLAGVNSFADEKYFYETFDEYATNDSPSEINVSTDNYYITEFSEKNKAVAVMADKSDSLLQFDVSVTGDFFLHFDIACLNDAVDGTVKISGGNESIEILHFDKNHRIDAYNGKPLFGYGAKNMTGVGILYNTKSGECRIYRNGKLISQERMASSPVLKSLDTLTISCRSEEPGNGIIVDNVYAKNSDKIITKFPSSEYNEEVYEKPDFHYGVKVGSRVIVNCDFEKNVPMNVYENGSVIEQVQEDEGNTVMLFERKKDNDFHMTSSGYNMQTDCMVMEFDLKVLNLASRFNVSIKDADGRENCYVQLSNGGALRLGNDNVSLAIGDWYRVAMMINTYDRVIDFYLNGEKKSSCLINKSFAQSSGVDLFRVHVPPSNSDGDNSVRFFVDNLRVYEAAEPVSELGEVKNEIVLNGKTVFPSDSSVIKSLEGYYGIHSRSGVVFANGQKSLCDNKPYEKDGKIFIDSNELSQAFGLENKDAGYVAIDDFAKNHSLVVTKVDIDKNSGLYVLGTKAFKVPGDSDELKKLNDYMLYLRPSPEQVKEIYNSSPLKGVHPRIQAAPEDFARIREQIETNAQMKHWSDRVIRGADTLLTTGPVEYELRDGIRLLYVCRDVLTNMYTLGMAYQLTGNTEYADRAWLDLNAVCKEFFDWHPTHDIDTGEMCAAVAIGYDWMYDAFSDEQRKIIEEGLYQKGLYEASLAYQSSSAAMSGIAYGEANHNVVCNGGITMAALAVMDVFPEEAYFLASCAARAAELNIQHFAPDGAYYEGPHYWEYAMQYASKLISSLDSVLGNSFGLDCIEGLDTAADFMIYMQSSNGIYNYGDGTQAKVYVPEMLWLSGKYNRMDTGSIVMSITDGNFSGGEDLALALLWYDTAMTNNVSELKKDSYYKGEDTISLRESWTDKDGAFVGIHAGTTNIAHSQLDGASFIYDNDGVRWAIDPGAGNYNQTGYWDSGEDGQRWKIFLSRAEAHNTVVVNPSSLPDHKVKSYAKMNIKSLKERGAIVEVDTTELLYDVSSAKRGYMFTDNRQSLVIRDEVNLTKESDVYWFMQTKADVQLDEKGATLVSDGKKLRLDFVSNASATIEVTKGVPLPTSPVEENDTYGNFNRIIIKSHGSGMVNTTVKLTPFDINSTDVTDYDKSIDEWYVPDGAIPEKPVLDSVKVNGVDMTVETENIVYNYVEGSLGQVPEIVGISDKHLVEVQKASSLYEPSKIIVTDKNDMSNKNVYNIYFNMLKKPKEFEGMNSVPVVKVEASSEPQPENGALNVIDTSLDTRWSAEGAGQTITLDIGEIKVLDKVALSMYLGNSRTTKITIQVSKDGYEFEDVFKGETSGTTNDFEFYDLKHKDARYVRFVCDGASNSTWNSISEIVIIQNK